MVGNFWGANFHRKSEKALRISFRGLSFMKAIQFRGAAHTNDDVTDTHSPSCSLSLSSWIKRIFVHQLVEN
jgi:hypothetical protein